MVKAETLSEIAGLQLTASAAILPEGLYRWKEFSHMVPIGRESWRKRVAEGTAPPKVQLGARCTAYRGADILEWLENPAGYRALARPTPDVL